jgi:hypothetical protein
VDAVNGSLDPYHFDRLPGADEVICVQTRNCPQGMLEADQVRDMLISKVQRLLFTSGFFRLRALHIAAEPIPGELCIPYWVGFRGRGATADIMVMDAVRRRMEGGKVRKLLQTWLLSPK